VADLWPCGSAKFCGCAGSVGTIAAAAVGIGILRIGYLYRIGERVRIRPPDSAIAGSRSPPQFATGVGAHSAVLARRGLDIRILHRTATGMESARGCLFDDTARTATASDFGRRSGLGARVARDSGRPRWRWSHVLRSTCAAVGEVTRGRRDRAAILGRVYRDLDPFCCWCAHCATQAPSWWRAPL
jgi:hypothetical protein